MKWLTPAKLFVWNAVCSEAGNCSGSKCPLYGDCFYYKARKAMFLANILIVNHAIFMTDLVLRASDVELLPDYDFAVIDEGHTLENVATDHLGSATSDSQVDLPLPERPRTSSVPPWRTSTSGKRRRAAPG